MDDFPKRLDDIVSSASTYRLWRRELSQRFLLI